MARPSKFSPEVRVRAVRVVEEHLAEYSSQWPATQSIAQKIGCTAESLLRRVVQSQRDAGHRPVFASPERKRQKQLEREDGEPKRANEVLRKALALLD